MANTPTSKVIFGTETLIDLTGDTAEAGDVLLGKSFHLASGAQGTGTLNPVLKEDIAGVESSSTASAAHASGTYLYYNNVLYKATADIAQGDSIVTSGASQNVELVTIGGELVSLNTSLAKLEVYVVTFASFNSLPQTYPSSGTDANIETDMVCIHAELSNPSAQLSNWEVDTDTAGKVTVGTGGSISGSTTLKLYLAKSR